MNSVKTKISLPKGWIRCRLEDVLSRISNGCSAKQYSEPIDKNSLSITRIETISNETINLQKVKYIDSPDEKTIAKYQLHYGDILLSHINSDKHLGKTAYFDLDNEMVIHGINLLLLRCSEEIDSKYILYHLKYLRNIGKFIEVAQRAVNQSSINQKKLKQFDLVLPPLPEQHRIVAHLDALLDRVGEVRQRLERVPELLRQFRQSVLARAISGELTRDWRGTEDLVDWKTEKAIDCCSKVQSGGTPKRDGFTDSGIPFLKVYNIVNQEIDFYYRPQFVNADIHKSKLKKSICLPGDVLMNIVGPPLGKIAIVPNDFPEWNHNQAITLFRPKTYLNKKFLYYFFCEGSVVKDIHRETRGMVGQSNISLTQCRNFEIPLPPLPEQQEIVRRVESLFAIADRLEERWEQVWANVETLPQAILAKAFRGELVAQDPNDEPASELLARIRKKAK